VVSIEEYTEDATEAADRVRSVLGPGKLFVKPARGGSSLGVTPVPAAADVRSALETAFAYDTAALVEEFVPHRELVLGVVGNDDLVVSPPGECRPVGDLYTYEAKYRLGNPRFRCPADLDPDLTGAARELAVRAFRAGGCSGFARVDLFLDLRDGRLLVNEINTIPGMTDVSVFPTIMAAAGWPYPRLLQEMLATRGR
jgi:D-alanine-D-alanine ligase